MAKDVQRQYKNNEVRTLRVVVGEITAKDDAPKAGDAFVVCTVPKGVVLGEIVVKSTDTDAKGKLTIGTITADKAFTATAAKASGVVTEKGKVTPEAQQVTVTLDEDLKYGRVQVGIQYLDLDTVSGDRVNALEA